MGWGNQAYGVERVGENYVVGGRAINLQGRHHMFMSVYDKFGDRIHETSLPELTKFLFVDGNNEIFIREDKAYWSSGGTGTFITYEYDIDGNYFSKIDTLETHELDFYGRQYLPSDDGIIINGRFTEEFNGSHFGIYKVSADSVSTLRVEDPYYKSYGARIFQHTDSTYVITTEYDDCNLCGRLRIYIVDEGLHIIDTITGNNDFHRIRTRDAIMDSLGNVVSCSLHTYRTEDGELRREPLISRINIHDKTEWDAKLGYVENEDGLQSGWWGIIEATDDDGYILAGSARIQNDSLDFSYATLAKMSIDGDSVWYRRYSSIDSTHAYHQFRDVTTTPEGGYMAVGYDACHAPLVGCDFGLRILLLKTDKDGLIVPDSMSSIATVDKSAQLSISAYPNPTMETLYVQHSAKQKIVYRLLDNQGRLVRSFHAGLSDETFILDVSDYPSGLYHLSYADEHGTVLGSELVVRK